MGFNSAWGYWLSAWLGNVAYGTLLFSSLGYFFPIFEGGQNVESIIGASVLLWCVHMLILRGVQSSDPCEFSNYNRKISTCICIYCHRNLCVSY